MNILIYGAGAIGQALGCMLTATGNSVDLILRERFIGPIQENGLQVSGVLGKYESSMERLGLYSDINQLKNNYDYALITTKSYDTDNAIRDLLSLGPEITTVVSMQNGCGNLEKLVKQFGKEAVLGARVITGFAITTPGHVEITVSADDIHIGGSISGEIPPTATTLAELITEAGHKTIAVSDIHQSLFAKLLYNCTLNPLGAILGVHYGALSEKEETRQIMDSVIEETFAVIEAIGGRTPWNHPDEYKDIFYSTLIPATYNHRASMLQDIENGKPTEVESLIGYVSSKGKEHNVLTPTSDILANLIRFKESAL